MASSASPRRPRTALGNHPPARRTHVLVATGGSPTGARTVPGELVLAPHPCGDPACGCASVFTGAASGVPTPVARVAVLTGVDRVEVRRALEAAMGPDLVPPAEARTEADRLLAIAAALPEHALVRREAGRIVPFASGGVPGGPDR